MKRVAFPDTLLKDSILESNPGPGIDSAPPHQRLGRYCMGMAEPGSAVRASPVKRSLKLRFAVRAGDMAFPDLRQSMVQFPLPRITDFLKTVLPFDTLKEDELVDVASKMQIAYYPRGDVIIQQGTTVHEYIYVLQIGSVRITIKDEIHEELIVDIRGEGETFGALSILQGDTYEFTVKAQEDVIAFLLPVNEFHELMRRHVAFEQHFRSFIARNFKSVSSSGYPRLHQPVDGPAANHDTFLSFRRVADLMATDLLTCTPDTSIRTAAQMMTARGVSSIIIAEAVNHPVGIVTDADLRSRVIAENHSVDDPITAVMSYPLHSIHPQAYAFDALLEMSKYGLKHLLVNEGGLLVGIICDYDFQMAAGSSPVSVIGKIEKSRSASDLISLHPKIDYALEVLLRKGGSIKNIVELGTRLNDRVTLQMLRITEAEMEAEGLGRVPVPYSWMALGSEGRREQTFLSDQDNSLVFADVPPKDEEEVRTWFLTFSNRVVEGLAQYGFPRCPGGIMASNPKWCRSESQWRSQFFKWIEDCELLSLRMASIFFDFRPIFAETGYLETLRETLHEKVAQNRGFLRHMAKNALYNNPPLGFLRQFVVEKTGEHKNTLNLKLRGVVPVVDAARVFALDLGIPTTNTLERLAGMTMKGVLQEELQADVKEAYSFITFLRINHHLNARARGDKLDNFVDPAGLTSLQRKMLKEAFSVISRLQEQLEIRYQTNLVLGD